MQALRLGKTELHPAMVGLERHWSSVGKDAFWNACWVTVPPVTVPEIKMASPALSKILPLVVTEPVLPTVSLSAVLPLAPASRVILPPFELATVPFTVNGLCATRLI